MKRKRNQTPGLYKRGDIWHIDRQVGNTHVRRSLKTAVRADALKQYSKIVNEILNFEKLDKIPERSFGEAIERYLEFNEGKKRSIKTDRSRFRVLLKTDPKLASTPLSKINNASLKNFVAIRVSEGVSSGTINRALALVSSVLNQAANKWEPRWLNKNEPIEFLPDNGTIARRPITWKEQRELVAVLPDHLADMVTFTCGTGLRDGEICRLRWDWLVNYPVINSLVIILPAEITKNGLPRLVPLNKSAREIINRRRYFADAHPTNVFHRKGKPISRMYNSAWMRARGDEPRGKATRASKRLPHVNMPGLRVHDLRHTAAQRLLDAGVDGAVRDALLGHADKSMRTRYAPPPIQDLLTAVESISTEPPEGSIERVPTVEEVIELQRVRKSA